MSSGPTMLRSNRKPPRTRRIPTMDSDREDEPALAIDIQPECHTELKLDPYTYFKRDHHNKFKPGRHTDLKPDLSTESKPDLLTNLKPLLPTEIKPQHAANLEPEVVLTPTLALFHHIYVQNHPSMAYARRLRAQERLQQWKEAISRKAHLLVPDSIAAEYPNEWMHEVLIRMRSPELSQSSVPPSWMTTTAADRAKMNITAADILWVVSEMNGGKGILVDVPETGLGQLWRDGARDYVLCWKAACRGTPA